MRLNTEQEHERAEFVGPSAGSSPSPISMHMDHTNNNRDNDRLSSATGASDHKPLSWFVILLTTTAAMGGFLFGYDTGVISGAMLLIDSDFNLTDFQEETVVGITVGFAAVASLAGGPAMQRWGRRPVILLAGAWLTVGAVVLAAAQSYGELVFGRLIVGVGIGLASLATPVYIAEAAPAHLRGKLVTLNTLFITGGQVIAGIVAGSFSKVNGGWRYMLGISGIPSLLLVAGFVFLPESPRWLVSNGKRGKAFVALQSLPEVRAEIEEELVGSNTEQRTGVPTAGMTVAGLLRDRRIRRALVLGCGLQLLQQLCGINTLMYYSATIMRSDGIDLNLSIGMVLSMCRQACVARECPFFSSVRYSLFVVHHPQQRGPIGMFSLVFLYLHDLFCPVLLRIDQSTVLVNAALAEFGCVISDKRNIVYPICYIGSPTPKLLFRR